MIDLYPSALPRPPEGTAPTELGPLADALWAGLAGITQALFPCSPSLLANAPKMRFGPVSGLRAARPLATKVGLMRLGSSRPTGTLAPSTATQPATH